MAKSWAKGETFPFAPDTPEPTARRVWMEEPVATYVAVVNGRIAGTYHIRANQPGLGGHVANAGYMVPQAERGQGIGRARCAHSLDEARRMGFQAMQYNLVVASNETAIRLWRAMGFAIVGTVPAAFDHATKGLVDAHVMYRRL